MSSAKYKNSPLGLIPEDWEVKALGEIIKLSSGKTKPKILLDLKNEDYNYPVFGGNGIMGYSNEYNSEGRVILIGRVGELCGITRLVEDKCWITDNALYTKEIFNRTDIVFLTYKLQYENLSKLRNKGGQPLVSQTPIYLQKVIITPDINEQTAIADCLSTWDKAIEKQNALIAQKELSKKALMQQLLSGKKRLKGFSDEWKKYTLNDVANFLNGKAYKQEELLNEGKYKVLRVGNFFSNSNWYYSDLELDDSKYVDKGDLMYAWSASFGPRFWDGEKTIYHYHIWKVIPLELIVKDFLYYFFVFDTEMIFSNKQGGTMFHVTKGDMEKRKIKLPSIEEQTAISNVLQCADDELQLLKKKLEQLKEQKKGLMQVLLTGKKRLKY